ncbi:hypothetical protein A0J61_04004 [Choanephora cucurbitarum]|uniref:Uncharacterized protein n=1 Tax=Choanephora cucurbitarum TaxID=101091 RepID=A0A1C7NFS5_9FUNG|nr:hypothetical protein A0J61_04004 [Choanephora cucurbitarum]
MNTVILPSKPRFNLKQKTKMSVSKFDLERINSWIRSDPRQIVTVDILGDQIDLPVYALRRRNAMVYL